jgi:hypothetical protein
MLIGRHGPVTSGCGLPLTIARRRCAIFGLAASSSLVHEDVSLNSLIPRSFVT